MKKTITIIMYTDDAGELDRQSRIIVDDAKGWTSDYYRQLFAEFDMGLCPAAHADKFRVEIKEHEETAVREPASPYGMTGTLRVEIREDTQGHLLVNMHPVGPVALTEIMRKQRALKQAGFTLNRKSLWVATNTPDHRAAADAIA